MNAGECSPGSSRPLAHSHLTLAHEPHHAPPPPSPHSTSSPCTPRATLLPASCRAYNPPGAPPSPNTILQDLAIVLGLAALVTVVFHRLRLPVVAGYILAGIAVGSGSPGTLIA